MVEPVDQRCYSLICTLAVSGALTGEADVARYSMIKLQSLRDVEILDPASCTVILLPPTRMNPLGLYVMGPVVTGSVACSGIYWNRRLQRLSVNREYAHGSSLQLFGLFGILDFQIVILLNISKSRSWSNISVIVWRKIKHLVAVAS